jgi:hypothetical protein
MTVTVTTHTKQIGWSRSDVIDLLEEAATTAGQNSVESGLIAGVVTWSGGGNKTSSTRNYYDAKATGGNGSGATFWVKYVSSNNSQNVVQEIVVCRPGTGYQNGDTLTIPASELGGTASGAADISVTIYIATEPVGSSTANTYAVGYDSTDSLTGTDRNGAVSIAATATGTITIQVGDTLELDPLDSAETFIVAKNMPNVFPRPTGVTETTSSYNYDAMGAYAVCNVRGQGAYKTRAYQSSTTSPANTKRIRWTPQHGQEGTYHINTPTGSSNLANHTITVTALGPSFITPKDFGSSTEAMWKDNPQGALNPYCVCRNVIDATKRYGITYTAFQIFDSYRLYIYRFSGVFPPGTEYTPQTNARGYNFDFNSSTTLDTYWDKFWRVYEPGWRGDGTLDGVGSSAWTGTAFTSSAMFANPVGAATTTYADSNATNAFSLDLITYRSGIDPNFTIYGFRQPNLSSTTLTGNNFDTFFLHDYTAPTLWDYDYLYLAGLTEIYPSGTATIYMNHYFSGMALSNDRYVKRSAEGGFLAHNTAETSSNQTHFANHSTGYSTRIAGYNDVGVKRYFRDATIMPVDFNGASSSIDVNSSTEYNAILKGLPLSHEAAPVPYYIPDDMVILDFSITTPSANIQPGDTITVSASEVYTVITGAYSQTGGTKGILMCARTT